MSLSEFWALTPYQTRLYVQAHGQRQQLEYRRALWAAWHIEAFQRIKQLPKLDDLLSRFAGKPVTRKSGQEILDAVRAMNAAAGGKDLTQNG